MSTNTKLIRLEDNSFIEVVAATNDYENVSSGVKAAKEVESTLDKVAPLLKQICTPIANTWEELNQEVSIEQAEVEIGLSFEAEGNIYITRSKAGANLNIKLVMKKKV